MGDLTLAYPSWSILLCLLLGAAFSAGLYYRDKTFRHAGPRARRWLLGLSIFRFLAVSIIAFLLLAPFIRNRVTEEEKPIIAVLQDNSASIASGLDSAAYSEAMQDFVDDLSKNYRVATYSFGGSLKEGLSFSFDDKTTDMATALEGLSTKYINQNLGAIILASDGIYNQGNNPIYLGRQLTAPVFAVALGDTTPKKDVKLSRVYHNSIAYLGDKTEVRMDIEALRASGEQTRLTVEHIVPGEPPVQVSNETINLTEDDLLLDRSILLDMKETGVQQYRISLSAVSNESNTVNNTQRIFIEVLDSRKKVLLVANAPHPDLTSIKSALEEGRNYEVDIAFAENPLPSIEDYNLVILHQLPSRSHNIKDLLTTMRKNNTSAFFVVGSQTLLNAFNQAQTTLTIESNTGNTNEVQAVPNTGFSLFRISGEMQDQLPSFPPLIAPFGTYQLNSAASILLSQKIGSVATDYPLLVYNQTLDQKVGILCAEGIWRWQLYDYMAHQNHDLFNDLVTKSVQYLAVKSDKRKFRVTLPKNIFLENEPVMFEAELYNESFELVNDPEVSLTIYNEANEAFPYTFNRSGNSYELEAGFFPVGSYRYEATVTFNGENYTATGQFSVSPVNLESVNTTANHQLMYLLSAEAGGELYYPAQLGELAERIRNMDNIKPILHDTYRTSAIINFKWLFFLILLLIAVEWFVRKFNGAY